MASIKTLIADDHPIFLEGLKVFLSKYPNLEIVGEAADGEEASYLLHQYSYDLVLLDINLPSKSGLDILLELQQMKKKPAVLMLSMYSEDEVVEVAIRRGADGYLVKNSQLKELFYAIEEIVNGGFYLGSDLQIDMPSFSITREEPILSPHLTQHYALTKRETEILSLIAKTRTNKQIGHMLNISDQTVGVHRKNILRKFGVHNTANLIRKVYEFERSN